MFVFKALINTQETWGMVEYTNKLPKIWFVYGTALAVKPWFAGWWCRHTKEGFAVSSSDCSRQLGRAEGRAGSTRKATTSLPDSGN